MCHFLYNKTLLKIWLFWIFLTKNWNFEKSKNSKFVLNFEVTNFKILLGMSFTRKLSQNVFEVDNFIFREKINFFRIFFCDFDLHHFFFDFFQKLFFRKMAIKSKWSYQLQKKISGKNFKTYVVYLPKISDGSQIFVLEFKKQKCWEFCPSTVVVYGRSLALLNFFVCCDLFQFFHHWYYLLVSSKKIIQWPKI